MLSQQKLQTLLMLIKKVKTRKHTYSFNQNIAW